MVLKLFELKISELCDPFEQCGTARFIVGQRAKWCIRPAPSLQRSVPGSRRAIERY